MGSLRFGTVTVALLAAIVVGLCGWATTARAGDAAAPSTDELIRRLQPTGAPPKPAFRGIEIGGKPPSGGPDQTQKPSVDLAVNFAFGSAQLTADGELLLDNLGRALEAPALEGSRFSIDGHTDAVGSADFNQRLSEQRAETVRQYLIARYGVDAGRLEAHGFGFTHLLDASDPTNGINRRVEITNLGAAQ
jgi:outer membrane protein OmpA-like peptidoglycan-associated protein